MELPPDVADRIHRNWGVIPDDVKDRLTRAGLGPAVAAGESTPAATVSPPPEPTGRKIAKYGGAAVGGAIGIPGGIPGVVSGALGGYGLGETGYDVATGKADPSRLGLQGLATAGLQATPLGRELTIGKRILGSGLVSSAAGQIYDLVHDWMTGTKRPVSERFKEAGGDILGGAIGQELAEVPGAYRRPPSPKAEAVASRRAQFQQAGIQPRASELLDSQAMAQIEKQPTRVPIGSGPVRRFEQARSEQARQSVGRFIPSSADPVRSSLGAVRNLKEHKEAFQDWARQEFPAIEAVTGDEPVVPTTRTRALAKSVLRESGLVPTAVAQGTGQVSRIGAEAPALRQRARLLASLGLDEEAASALEAAANAEKIPFWAARRLESFFGEKSRSRLPIGTLSKGRAGALYASAHQDLNDFLTSTDEGQQIAPRLAEAKQRYATNKELLNHSVVTDMLNSETPSNAVALAFRPGNIDATLDFKTTVSDDVWQQAVDGWKKGLYDQAITRVGDREVFSTAKFANKLRPYLKHDHLDLILPPDEVREFKNLLNVFDQMKYAANPAENPSGTAQGLLTQGQLGTLLSSPVAAVMGHPLGAIASALGVTVPPMSIGQATTRPGGIDFLTALGSGQARLPMSLRQFGGQLAGQGLTR